MIVNGAKRMMFMNNGMMGRSTLLNKASMAMIANQPQNRNFATLILAEHFEGKLNSQIGSCLKAAQDLNDNDVSLLQFYCVHHLLLSG